jgi:hypothetical protein
MSLPASSSKGRPDLPLKSSCDITYENDGSYKDQQIHGNAASDNPTAGISTSMIESVRLLPELAPSSTSTEPFTGYSSTDGPGSVTQLTLLRSSGCLPSPLHHEGWKRPSLLPLQHELDDTPDVDEEILSLDSVSTTHPCNASVC